MLQEQAILIIEDDPAWQDILSEISYDAGFQPVVVSSYGEALAALARQSYALAVIDVSLSEAHHANRDGVKALRKISALPARLPAIIITGYATVELAIETLVELNAVHFFRKENFDRRQFIRVVKKEAVVSRGLVKPSPRIPASFRQKLEPGVVADLSERELEVLYLLSQGQTNKQIAAELTITANTVKKHVQSIFTKLNVSSRAAAVTQVLGREK